MTDTEGIEHIIVEFYKRLFSGKEIEGGAAERLLSKIKGRVTDSDRSMLNTAFTKKEVEAAISGLSGGKALGRMA